MSGVLKRLEAEMLKLPVRSRSRLARELLASLDRKPLEPDVEALWAAEAQRRADELARGKTKGISAAKVFKKARAALR